MLCMWRQKPGKRAHWNKAREQWPEWLPLLNGHSLAGFDLSNANLSGANLSESNLDNATLTGANLSKSDLSAATLREANLIRSDLSSAYLCGADLSDTTLFKANLAGAVLHGAKLDDANISLADLRMAMLRFASIKGVRLDGVRGMRLDGNDIREVRFPPNTSEAWHVIRRAYTGTKFFFHLLLLVIFFGSMGLRTALWVGVNRAQAAVVNAAERLDVAAESVQVTTPDFAAAMHIAAHELSKVQETFTQDTSTYQVWQVLLGVDRGWWAFALAVLLVVYNIARVWLTYMVGALREESDRSGYAPYWADYKWAWYWHNYVMRWLIFFAFGSFAYHAWFWLTSAVVLPG